MQEFENLIQKLTIPVTIALMAGLARFAFSEQKSIWTFFRGMLIASFVGLMTGNGLQDSGLGDGMKFAIIGATSFCADEVLSIIIKIVVWVKEDPVNRIREVFRLRK